MKRGTVLILITSELLAFTLHFLNSLGMTLILGGLLWGAVLVFIPYSWISINHLCISKNRAELRISIIHIRISINRFMDIQNSSYLRISKNQLWISKNQFVFMDIHKHFWISINRFMDIQYSTDLWISNIQLIYGYPKMNYGYLKMIYGYPKLIYGYPKFIDGYPKMNYGYP